MENASKALIIAGAILISIVLIGVGVYLVSSINRTTETGADQLDQTAITAFNSPFETYEGKQNGSNVKALIGKISTHNVTNQENESKMILFNNVKVDGDNVSEIRSEIDAGTTYTVKLKYDSKTGLITEITTE